MKRILPILFLAGLSLAFYGCDTTTNTASAPSGQEAPRGTEATTTDATGAGPSTQEQARDVAIGQDTGASMKGGGGNAPANPDASGSSQMQSMSPYGH